MDQNLLQRTADDVSESITSVSQAFNTLEEASTQLRQTVSVKFDEAVAKDDLASVERFFKIFPLLGLHTDGIVCFGKYICSKVLKIELAFAPLTFILKNKQKNISFNFQLDKKAQKELRTSFDIATAEKRISVAFADTLTLLFENFARVMEVNQPIIENYYGYGKLIQFFEILQIECDKEVRRLIAEFHKSRLINRRKTQINEFNKSSGQQGLGHFRKPSGGSVDRLNPKDIDSLIGEITVMHARAELYIRFMRRRIQVSLQSVA